jgi:hypothetical protein
VSQLRESGILPAEVVLPGQNERHTRGFNADAGQPTAAAVEG